MTILRVGAAAAALLASTALTPASAEVFNRIATFHVADTSGTYFFAPAVITPMPTFSICSF